MTDAMMSTFGGATATPRRSTWVQRRARNAVFGLLRHLEDAYLTLVDPEVGAVSFGNPAHHGPRRAVLHIASPAFYTAATLRGPIGVGEAYRDGLFTTGDLTGLIRIFVRNRKVLLDLNSRWSKLARRVFARLHARNENTRAGSGRNITAHYDLGNDFFRLFLDESMTYSSGVFGDEETSLADAQDAKYDRLCRKAGVGPGDHVLEVGCGWGGFALHAARRHDCHVTGVTISPAQLEIARGRVVDAELGSRVDIRLQDYRDLTGRYDALVSIEMIEAVGYRYYDAFFERAAAVLKSGGTLAMQAITMPHENHLRARGEVDFIQAHIFPGSCIPSVHALSEAAAAHGLVLEDREDLTDHYVRTLHAWRDRLLARSTEALALGLDDAFLRLWEFYLCYCAGGFAERGIHLEQLVFRRQSNAAATASATR